MRSYQSRYLLSRDNRPNRQVGPPLASSRAAHRLPHRRRVSAGGESPVIVTSINRGNERLCPLGMYLPNENGDARGAGLRAGHPIIAIEDGNQLWVLLSFQSARHGAQG